MGSIAMTRETEKYLLKIIENGDEFEAIKFLILEIENDITSTRKNAAHNSACLRAIKKINAGKNDAIDALCE